ncbi:MAG: thioredoxin family protein, partial [Clostridiales bacterium]|nr:thioredoxin family protein [Clostridiales bacterium]
MPKKVGSDTFRAQVLEAQRPVVAEFYADGCVPCRRLAPILSALEEDYAGTVDFVKINTGANEALTQTSGMLSSARLLLLA